VFVHLLVYLVLSESSQVEISVLLKLHVVFIDLLDISRSSSPLSVGSRLKSVLRDLCLFCHLALRYGLDVVCLTPLSILDHPLD
jgi:hypothetical protein